MYEHQARKKKKLGRRLFGFRVPLPSSVAVVRTADVPFSLLFGVHIEAIAISFVRSVLQVGAEDAVPERAGSKVTLYKVVMEIVKVV